MENFEIEVRETYSRIVEIEAISQDEALEKLRKMYEDEDIVLTPDDYTDTQYFLI